jgi:hypothetical protein
MRTMAFRTDIYRVWYADVEKGLGGRVGVSKVEERRINILGASAAGQIRSPDMATVEFRLKPGR